MKGSGDLILQFSDLVSTRKCALRIDASEAGHPLGYLLDKYVKRADVDSLFAGTSLVLRGGCDGEFGNAA